MFAACAKGRRRPSPSALSGSPRLSELSSGRCSGGTGSPPPPRRLDGLEVFHHPACPCIAARTAPAGLGTLSGHAPRHRPRSPDRGFPSWGSSPLQRRELAGPYVPGSCLPGTIRPRGFPPPRRFAPRALCGLEGRCRSWGSFAFRDPLWLLGVLRRRRTRGPLPPRTPLLEL
jgi:hypothetical protein